jgi:gliding motility-associated-like protein
MKHLQKFLVLILLCPLGLSAQLAINTGWTPNQLVQNVLVGTGVVITNVTYTGAAVAIGEFNNGGTTNIGLNRGIIMSSGAATIAVGPNNSGSAGQSNNQPGDPQLAALIPGYTCNDASVLEFDFVPLSDTIRFRYVFASDEYPEFSGSSFNDVFGFFISGPQPGLPVPYLNYNMARLPITNLPVTINTVNNGTGGNGPCMNCQYYVNNNAGITIQYDGFTTVLTAWAAVVPCQQYHFKIAVADAGDYIYDSAVFLEENSFSTDAITVSTDYTVPGAGANAIEGCNYAVVKFKLAKWYTDTFWVHIDTVYGTATNGIDFSLIPDSIGIPPYQTLGQLIIDPFVDYTTEGTEWVHIVIPSSVCTKDTVHVPIIDYVPITITVANDTAICQSQANLWVQPINGAPPYTYNWTPTTNLSNPAIPNPIAAPPVTTTFVVAVSDGTSCPPVLDSIKVTVNPMPMVSFTINPDPAEGCEPYTVSFTDFSNPSIQSWNWNFGDGSNSNQQNPTHTYMAGQFDVSLEVTTADGCSSILSVADLVLVHPTPTAFFDADPWVASVDFPNINFIDMSINAAQWGWNFGDPSSGAANTSTIQNPSHAYASEGEYIVILTVISPYGCIDTVQRTVKIVVDRIKIPNIITPNGDGVNDFLEIENAEYLDWSELIIYNRWGKRIAKFDGYNNSSVRWDAEGMNDGVYYYIFKYKTYFTEAELNGTITVMRD